MASIWRQRTIALSAKKRGCHSVTQDIEREIAKDLASIDVGVAHFFLQHTSASLCVNESWDPEVMLDMEDGLNRIAPQREGLYRHSMEGPDDMPAHIKSALVGVSLSIPITQGKLNMGRWQGIWLLEHRDHASKRKVVITLNGCAAGEAPTAAASPRSSDAEEE